MRFLGLLTAALLCLSIAHAANYTSDFPADTNASLTTIFGTIPAALTLPSVNWTDDNTNNATLNNTLTFRVSDIGAGTGVSSFCLNFTGTAYCTTNGTVYVTLANDSYYNVSIINYTGTSYFSANIANNYFSRSNFSPTTDIGPNSLQLTSIGAPYNNTAQSYQFDGATTNLSAGNSSKFATAGNVTFGAWVYQTSRSGTDRVIFKGSQATSNFEYILGPDAVGSTMRCLKGNSSGGSVITTDNTTFPVNTWVHFACVYDASIDRIYLYRNGALANSTTGGLTPMRVTTGNLTIGYDGMSGNNWIGGIKDVRIFNASLSAAQVLALANSNFTGAPVASGNLIASYPMANMTFAPNETMNTYQVGKNNTFYSILLPTDTISNFTPYISYGAGSSKDNLAVDVSCNGGGSYQNNVTSGVTTTCTPGSYLIYRVTLTRNNTFSPTLNQLNISASFRTLATVSYDATANTFNLSNVYLEAIVNASNGGIISIKNNQNGKYVINATPGASTYTDVNLAAFAVQNITTGATTKTNDIGFSAASSNLTYNVSGGKLLVLNYTRSNVTLQLNLTIYDNQSYLQVDQQWNLSDNTSRYDVWFFHLTRLFSDADMGGQGEMHFFRPNSLTLWSGTSDSHRFIGSTYYGVMSNTTLLGILADDRDNITGYHELFFANRTSNRLMSVEMAPCVPGSEGASCFFSANTALPFHGYLWVGNSTDMISFVNFAETKLTARYGPQKDVSRYNGGSAITGVTNNSLLGLQSVTRWMYTLGANIRYNNLTINQTALDSNNATIAALLAGNVSVAHYDYPSILDDSGEFMTTYGCSATCLISKTGGRRQWGSTTPVPSMAVPPWRGHSLMYARNFSNYFYTMQPSNVVMYFDGVSTGMQTDFGQFNGNHTTNYTTTPFVAIPAASNYSHDDAYVSSPRAFLYDFMNPLANYLTQNLNTSYLFVNEGRITAFQVYQHGLFWEVSVNKTYKFATPAFKNFYTIRSDEGSYYGSSKREDSVAWMRVAEGGTLYDVWLSDLTNDTKMQEIRRAVQVGQYVGAIQSLAISGNTYVANFNSTQYQEIIGIANYDGQATLTVTCRSCNPGVRYNVAILGAGYSNYTSFTGAQLVAGVGVDVPSVDARVILITNNTVLLAFPSAWNVNVSQSGSKLSVTNSKLVAAPVFITNTSENDYWDFTNKVLSRNASNFTVNVTSASYSLSLPFRVASYNITDTGGKVYDTAGNSIDPNLGVNVTSSGNTITLSSGLNYSLNATVALSTNGIIPSSPRVTYGNGTSETPTYASDGASLALTLASLPSGLTNLTIDAAGPSISLVGPAEGASSAGGSVTFAFTPVDDNNISNCSLVYGNAGLVYTTSSAVTNNGSNTFTATGVDDHHVLGGAPLTWSVSCTDVFGNVGTSSTSHVVTIATATGGASGGGGGRATGGTTPSVVNSSNSTSTAGSMNESVNTTVVERHLDLTPDENDRSSRRNFLLVVIGSMAMIIAGIGVLSFVRK